jgi:hypothetical protein
LVEGLAVAGYDHVRVAVAVYVCDCHRIRLVATRVITDLGLKCAIAIAQQHTYDPYVLATDHDHVQITIAVQISDRKCNYGSIRIRRIGDSRL